METFLQLTASGLIQGLIYGFIALGFVVVFKSSGVLNLAQGELVMLGAYICWFFMAAGLAQYGGYQKGLSFPFWAAIIITLVCAVILGLLIERFVLRPLIGQPLLVIIMMTIVLSVGLKGLSLLFWGGETSGIPVFPPKPLVFGPLLFSPQSLLGVGLAAVGVVIFILYFRRSRTGLAMRAVADDHQSAQSAGVAISKIFANAWVVAAVIGAAGGILLAMIAGVNMGLTELGMKVLPIVILGGLESIPGAIVAGLIVGVCEMLAVGYLEPALVGVLGFTAGGMGHVFPFILMTIVLIVRPFGLFGLQRIERV